ncbi:MAG: PAS domain S-box protein [Deltaproteobacteria bacterium]|nr:PAS domain S-box protein [Deltaproteobacteria bacterium]
MARILIVDDDWLQRLTIARMLTDLGYEVAGQAETGAEAVAMARELKPDLILIDVVMPGEMNGIEAALKIKMESDIPIIFISGYGDSELIEKAKRIEPFGYVMKPFDETEVKAFVEIALHKSKIEKKLGQANRQLNELNLSLQREIKNRKRAEEALSNSQRIAKLGSWELDLNTLIITLSKEHQFMAGKEPVKTALPLDEYAADYVVEEDVPILQKRLAIGIQNIENTSYNGSFEYRLKTDDVGGYKNLAVESRFKSKGVVNGVTQDITERKQAEEVLRHSEEKHRELVENLNNVIYSVNAEGRITYVSPPVEPILGYAPAELVGKHFTYLVHSEDLDAIQRAFADTLHGRHYPSECRIRAKSGRYLWARAPSLPIRDDGRIIGLQGVITDITEHKRTEEALLSSEEKYRTILESIGDGYFEVDIAGNLTFFNDSFCRIVGYSEDELMGTNYKDNTDKEAGAQIFQIFNRVHRTGKPIKGIRHSFERKDGRKVHIEVSVSLINNSEGRRIGFRGITRDVTEKEAADEERLMLEDQLHQAQKMAALGTLVAGVAHEINNPNNFITINAPMVNKAWLSIIPVLEAYYDHNGDFSVGDLPYTIMRERMSQLLSGITDGAGRINKIVSDLKRFARPDSSLSSEPVDINSVVKSSLTLVSNLLKKSTNNFKIEYGRNIPKINGNHQKLEQVVINLLQNACLALPDKNKKIKVTTTYREKEETILIKVRDQGVGIPAESLPRIMDPFFTTRRSSGGTGLGLSVSFSIIEKHSGNLTVASEDGKGSTFTIALPAKGEKGRVRVLVVDDDDMFREMIVEILKMDSAFSIEESPNGMDACIKLGAFRPDLLILDIRMPDMSGVEVCRRIKEDPEFGNMKVIVITGFPEDDDARKISGMGFNNFCSKPFKMKDFEAMVQKVLD